MQSQDYPRLLNAIDEAIQGLELEARCYSYTDEPEHTELIALLQNYKAELKEKEKREHYIWKAKHQRGLTDEQINFFLQNHPRWELLPVYSLYVKKLGEQGALEQIKQEYGSDTKEERRESRSAVRNCRLKDFLKEE